MTSRRTRLLPLLLLAASCTGRPFLTDAEIDSAELGKALPQGFLLGAATAAHQVEGGMSNDWTDWEAGTYPDGRPHILHGDTSGLACDSWNRFDQDVQLLKHLGANAYRLSVEWSRLEPTEGTFDTAALERYRSWMQQLRAEGITPMVTLYHFTLPKWVAAQGGWESDETVDDFVAYARRVTEALGAEVDLWVTINEPNVLAVNGYLKGIWPPGKTSNAAASEVLARLLTAHGKATKAIREADTHDADGDGKATAVGIAHHVRIFQPTTGATLDNAIAALTDDFFNESALAAQRTGRILLSVPGNPTIDLEVPELKGSFDFIGLNYYTRDFVRADLADPSFSRQYVPADRPVNDLKWDLYPEGFYLALKRLGAEGLPVYVTENGMADNTANGEQRPRVLRTHLAAMERAVKEGVDVRGYLHWSLMDNFEWAEGFEPRFGLFRVDFASPERTRTPTAAVDTFQDVARNLGLTPEEG